MVQHLEISPILAVACSTYASRPHLLQVGISESTARVRLPLLLLLTTAQSAVALFIVPLNLASNGCIFGVSQLLSYDGLPPAALI